ncbi:S8 family serine peptidase [Archangium sp.]|uniref:S8 family serine peptidase n=1 Tax=Archangium sp. TaxID=1872627 RepID=UPI00286CBC4C|nr:S8 family serine peptidase [Archangium sp.]
MRHVRLSWATAALTLAGCAAEEETESAPQQEAVGERQAGLEARVPGRLLGQRTRVTARGTFTDVKYLDEGGRVHGLLLDARGNAVPESAVEDGGARRLGDALAATLKEAGTKGSTRLTVDVALQDELEATAEPVELGGSEVLPFSSTDVTLNGKKVSQQELDEHTARKLARLDDTRKLKRQKRLQTLQTLTRREGLGLSRDELEALADDSGSIVLQLEAGRIERFLADNADLVAAIDLHQEPTDNSLATAMAATSVSPGALGLTNSRGAGIGIYMTESGCPDPGVITNYTRLAGSNTDHSRNVSSIVRAVSPDSWVYCRGSGALPTLTDLAGTATTPRIFVSTRSNSSVISDDYGTPDRDWDNFSYNNAVLMLNSASNEGNTTGTIGSPGKGFNILTVGNYNDATNTINGSSSWLDPTTKNRKPELSGPGTGINAGGFTMTGTSQSTPHVAGIAADFMSAYSWLRLRPHLAKAFLIASATDSISGDFDRVGAGGVDYMKGYQVGAPRWFEGANGDFASLDAQDPEPNNGTLDATFNVNSNYANLRVAIAWLNRGTYTYDHRADVHPIGMDLDFAVYGPDGSYLGGSASWDDPFEVIDIVPPMLGKYTVRISRTSNRDTLSKLHVGLMADLNN